MSQSNVVAFFLIAGFIVFITIKGELPAYLGILGLGNVVFQTGPTAVPNVVTNTYSQNPPQSSGGGIGGFIGSLIGGAGALFGL